MTWGEEKVPLSRRPPRGHSSVLQRMGREATAQKSDDFMTPVYHIYEACSASKFQASHRKSPFESAMLLTSRIRGKSLATTSPPSSACRTQALACTRYRLCHLCLNHHALRRRVTHAFVPWIVFDILTLLIFLISNVLTSRHTSSSAPSHDVARVPSPLPQGRSGLATSCTHFSQAPHPFYVGAFNSSHIS